MTYLHFITAASITNLLSGLVGAIAGSTLSVWATIYTDKKSKEWNLKVELRKHRVARLVAANDGLRTSFYRGWTQLDYHLLALTNIESDLRRELPHSKGWDSAKRKIDKETERYNEQVGATEADARAHMSFLDEALIPPSLLRDMEQFWHRSLTLLRLTLPRFACGKNSIDR